MGEYAPGLAGINLHSNREDLVSRSPHRDTPLARHFLLSMAMSSNGRILCNPLVSNQFLDMYVAHFHQTPIVRDQLTFGW